MQLIESTKFDYNYLIKLEKTNKNDLNDDEISYLLNWINYRVREILLKESVDFSGLCSYAADLLALLLASLNIRFYQVSINGILNNEQLKHVITIVNFGITYDTMYVLDPTYKQFLNNPIFNETIKMTENGVSFSENLVINGYFKLTLDNLKIYFDIFNHFKKLNDINSYFEKDISGEEYLNKLFKCPVHQNYPVNPSIALPPSKLATKS